MRSGCFQCWFEKQPEERSGRSAIDAEGGRCVRTRTENAGESLVLARQRPPQFPLRPYRGWSGFPSTRTTLPPDTEARTPHRQKHISQVVAIFSTRAVPVHPGGWTGGLATAGVAAAPAPSVAAVPRKRLRVISFLMVAFLAAPPAGYQEVPGPSTPPWTSPSRT